MSDDLSESDVAAARAWMERYLGFAPADDSVVAEIAWSGLRFADAAREAADNLAFDSDAQQFHDLLVRLRRPDPGA